MEADVKVSSPAPLQTMFHCLATLWLLFEPTLDTPTLRSDYYELTEASVLLSDHY